MKRSLHITRVKLVKKHQGALTPFFSHATSQRNAGKIQQSVCNRHHNNRLSGIKTVDRAVSRISNYQFSKKQIVSRALGIAVTR